MQIKGDRVFLRSIVKDDAKLLLTWRNSKHVARNSLSGRRITCAEHARWLRNLLRDKTRLTYIIMTNDANRAVGRVGLKDIDLIHKRAELEKLIGEKEFQGQGFATEASKLLLKYAFGQLGLRKIYAKVLAYNLANIRVNKKLGFKIEGRLRKHAFIKNKRVDILLMGLLKEGFLIKVRRWRRDGKRI